ncbi:MAG: hypothetical protein AAFP84_01385 [Actinomycetota bacterium]
MNQAARRRSVPLGPPILGRIVLGRVLLGRGVLGSLLLAPLVLAMTLVAATPAAANAADGDCDASSVDADFLDAAFDAGIGEGSTIVGADYQRAFELDDGRILWVFQDAFVERDGATTFVHNVGAVQRGACFEVLAGDGERPTSMAGAATTTDFVRWFWPLDGFQTDRDTFILFLAEMREVGGAYLTNAVPTATSTVEIDLATGAVGRPTAAPDPSAALHGFEITEDDEYRYLYAHCHRQFGFGWLGHDRCVEEVTVARTPLDGPTVPLEYWTGAEWTTDSGAAANIAPTTMPDGSDRGANPMQVQRDGERWIAATKVDDWWGESVVFDVAPAPQGPWTTTAVVPVAPDGDGSTSSIEDGASIASYFVSFVPSDDRGYTLAISNNRWDGEFSEWYRPRFHTVHHSLWADGEPTPLDHAGRWWLPSSSAGWLFALLTRG